MTIYVDLDGVLANFASTATKLLGGDPWEVEVKKPNWGRLSNFQNIYYDLEPMDDAFELYQYLVDNFSDVQILTAIPYRAHFPEAVNDKRAWVHERFNSLMRVNFGPYAYDKQFYCKPGDILIDDSHLNCRQWQWMGGIAIHHKNAMNTIALLDELDMHDQKLIEIAEVNYEKE